MSFLGLMLRTGMRHRWRSWLVLMVLIALVLAGSGAPPSALIGIRNALERGEAAARCQ